MQRAKKIFIILLGLWLLFLTTAVTIVAITGQNPVAKAVLGMSWGLIILWILIGGSLMYRLRDRIKNVVLKIRLQWQIKFVLFVTLLALLEEVITTLMTNLAPAFGVKLGEAYIVASTNFLDDLLTDLLFARCRDPRQGGTSGAAAELVFIYPNDFPARDFCSPLCLAPLRH